METKVKKVRRARNAAMRSIAEEKIVKGFYMGCRAVETSTGEQRVSKKFGTPLMYLELRDQHGEILPYWVDGGLRGAISLAGLKGGEAIEIEHTGEKAYDLNGEQVTVQTYAIYDLVDEEWLKLAETA